MKHEQNVMVWKSVWGKIFGGFTSPKVQDATSFRLEPPSLPLLKSPKDAQQHAGLFVSVWTRRFHRPYAESQWNQPKRRSIWRGLGDEDWGRWHNCRESINCGEATEGPHDGGSCRPTRNGWNDWKSEMWLRLSNRPLFCLLQEMQAQSFIFLVAGYETTSTALGFLAHELARNPDVQHKLQMEIHDHFPEKVSWLFCLQNVAWFHAGLEKHNLQLYFLSELQT